SSFFGLPANAPFKSTRCKRCAPSSSQCCAIAAGSSENTVADCISPCLRRTQWPSLMSIAGMICMAAEGDGMSLGWRRSTDGTWLRAAAHRRAQPGSDAPVPGDEVREQLETGAVALLGVELHGEDISASDRASKR